MSKAKTYSKSKGATTGLGILTYFATLFDANELAPKKKKMTDAKILDKVLREFPTRKSMNSFRTGKTTVNDYRRRYNKGVFTRKVPPERMSFRYGRNNKPVNGRTGKQELLPEEIDRYKRTHKRYREGVIQNAG